MKICPKCNNEHEKPGTYCSRTCANSRVFSVDSNKKRSASNKAAVDAFSVEKKQEIIAKRVSTRKAKHPATSITECIICSKIISIKNKHKMCQVCYYKSDACAHALGHYRKYKRLTVTDSYGNAVFLLSSLEIEYYNWLVSNNIVWKKPESIHYTDNFGKSHWYKPDFHLVDSNEIIEIKGYFWNNDKIKMEWVKEQHPLCNIKILTKTDLKKLKNAGE